MLTKIICDTRQKNGCHKAKEEYFAKHGILTIRSKTVVGDYQNYDDLSVAVDTKRDMAEIAGNLCGNTAEHERVRNECVRARELGTKLYFLIENTDGIKSINDVFSWENPRRKITVRKKNDKGEWIRVRKYPRAVTGDRLAKTMLTMQHKYGCEFVFCHPVNAGFKVVKLLEGKHNVV